MTSSPAFVWLVHGTLASTVLLALGALAVSLCRQPADRLRMIQCSLAATLCAFGLAAIPQFGAISLGLLKSTAKVQLEAPSPAIALKSTPRAERTDLPNPPQTAASLASDEGTSVAAPVMAEIAAGSDHVATDSPPGGQRVDLAELVLGGLLLGYFLAVVVLLVRWLSAQTTLWRLKRRAGEATPAALAELARIAGPESRRVRLLVSDELAGPFTFGIWQRVIVLPASALEEDPRRLRYYLAHEWGHVARRDVATWQFASLLQIVLCYQPLLWWLRNQLAICMDQLADADAAEQGESTVDYAEFLVQFAKRLSANPRLSLGIGGNRSSLQQRVVLLLNAAARPRAICPPNRSLAIGTVAILLAAFVSVVRLDAEPIESGASAEQTPAPQQVAAKPETTPLTTPDAITYDCVVINAETEEPIAGVKVSVLRKNSREWSLIETTEHETDAEGRYRFTIPPEQVALDGLYIEVEAHHPNYASKSRSGYSHGMIRKNLLAGEPPFYSKIRLWPGEAVTGTVVNPAGEPVEDAEITMYSKSAKSKEFFGAFGKTRTDATGRFRIVPATPGDGVLWIKPANYAPQAHRLADRRGDWGQLTVEKGADLIGRVLDVQGAAVPGVRIEARRRGDGEEADEFLQKNAVANHIGRETVSDSEGRFTLAALPDGDYTLDVKADSKSYDPPPLEQVFVRQPVTIAAGVAPTSLEIRALPHVMIHGTYLDSAGKPRRGHEVNIFGRLDGEFFYAQSTQPGEDGKFEIRAPHGLQEAELDLITNEHSALRWRISHEEPLMRGRRIKLGTLEDDRSGLEVVRYTAPILLIKVVDQAGAVLEDATPVVKYMGKNSGEELTVYTTGGNVSFEKQPDGRWRSSQLLPDERVAIDIKEESYSVAPQELSLAEGAEQEVVLVAKPKTASESAEVATSEDDAAN